MPIINEEEKERRKGNLMFENEEDFFDTAITSTGHEKLLFKDYAYVEILDKDGDCRAEVILNPNVGSNTLTKAHGYEYKISRLTEAEWKELLSLS